MNLLDIILVKKFARVEYYNGEKALTKIVERDWLITEVANLIENLSEDNLPIEITFKETETNSSVRIDLEGILEKSLDYVILEKKSNSFVLFCEKNSKLKKLDDLYIRWDFHGVKCVRIKEKKSTEVKTFLFPISEKKLLTNLKADEMHKIIMLNYEKTIEFEDLLSFQQIGDEIASQFLSEIATTLLEIISETKTNSQKQKCYVSKVFTLFREKDYIRKINREAQSKLETTIN